MPSTIWSGAVSFGLVSVPVKMVGATVNRDISFNQLERETGARIRYRRVSEATGDEVTNNDIVKGYEIAKGQYVIIDGDELDALRPKASKLMEIETFVDLDEIDPMYFDQPYYLQPDANAAKPYKLLVETMTQLRKVAIGRVVLRTKEYLVAIRPLDGVLCVETLRYDDEIVPANEIGGPSTAAVEVSDKELAMARQLVEALSEEFDASKLRNDYREQLLSLIEQKAAGHEIVAEPMVEAPAQVLDLMAALEASLAKAGAAPDSAAVASDNGPTKAAKPAKKATTAKVTKDDKAAVAAAEPKKRVRKTA